MTPTRRAVLAAGALSASGLAGCLGVPEYRVAEARVEADAGPLALAVRVVESDAVVEHPAELELAVTNAGDGPVRVWNYGVWPFGVLAVSDSPGEGFDTLVDSPAYGASDRVTVERNGSSVSVDDEPIVRSLDPGERVTASYFVAGRPLHGAGTYYVDSQFEDNPMSFATNGYRTAVDLVIVLRIEKLGWLPQ